MSSLFTGILSLAWGGDQLEKLAAGMVETTRLGTARSGAIRAASDTDPSARLSRACKHLGVGCKPVKIAYKELDQMLRKSAPAIVQLVYRKETLFFGLIAASRGNVTLLGPSLTTVRVKESSLARLLGAPAASPLAQQLAPILEGIGLQKSGSGRALGLIDSLLAQETTSTCYFLSPLATARGHTGLQGSGLTPLALALVALYALRYFLFVASWALLGRGALEGHLELPWLASWALLLTTMVPVGYITARLEGTFSIRGGCFLKGQLMRGLLRLDRDRARQFGAGQWLGRVAESEALESLAVSGGLATLTGLVEMVIAFLVLLQGAGGAGLTSFLALVWGGLVLLATVVIYRRRRDWTATKIDLIEFELENLIGYRTRLVQEPQEQWHEKEDEALLDYLKMSCSLDRQSAWLSGTIGRSWLVVSLVSLIPMILSDKPQKELAISLGAMLLFYGALNTLGAGLGRLSSALIAWKQIGFVLSSSVADTEMEEAPVANKSTMTTESGERILDIQKLSFSHAGNPVPILRHVDFQMSKGERILITGPSGSGKSSLLSLLSGLRQSTSGLVLYRGLDLHTMGQELWRKCVTLVPQFHENYILSGSLAFNLLVGRGWEPSEEDLGLARTVCKELGLGELLATMPNGIHQLVGESGWQLSHGEQTRVFLARAVLQEPEVLLLDEAFGPLDPQTLSRCLKAILHRVPSVVLVEHW